MNSGKYDIKRWGRLNYNALATWATNNINNEIKILSGILCFCLLLFSQYIFGGFAYLFNDIGSDTINSYFPSIYFKNTLFSNFTYYSFKTGIGGSTWSWALFDPFSIFLYIIPKANIAAGIVYSMILKILFASYFSYKFILMLLGKENKALSIIPAISISFSGFFILWGQHTILSSTFAFLPLILFSYEKLLQENKRKEFALTIAISSIFFYGFYQMAIFFSFYSVVRAISYYGSSDLKRIGTHLIHTLLLAILGLSLSAIILLPQINNLLNSPRIDTASSSSKFLNYFTLHNGTFLSEEILKLFSNNFFGNAKTYFGIANYYESPQVFVSLLMILFTPLFFLNKKAKLRSYSICIITFIILLFISPFISFIFNGMQYPAYRWGMISSVAISSVGIIGLQGFISSKNQYKWYYYSISAFVLILLLFILPDDLAKHKNSIYKTLGFLVLYTVTIAFSHKNKKVFNIVILLLVLAEMYVEHYPTLNSRSKIPSDLKGKSTSYFNSDFKLIEEIKSKDSSFFRLAKNKQSQFLNDSYVQGYNGLTQYNSTMSPYYISFIKKMNIPLFFPGNTSYVKSYNDRDILLDLLCVKYLISDGTHSLSDELISKIDSRHLYKRSTSLPFGITYDTFAIEDDIDVVTDIDLLKTVILDSSPKINIDKHSWVSDHTDTVILDIQSFKPANIQKNNLFSESLNTDPTLTYTGNDLRGIQKLEVKLHSKIQSKAQLFWMADHTGFSEINSKTLEVSKGENLLIYDLTSVNDIRAIRLDPIRNIGKFRIDYIKAVLPQRDRKVVIPINLEDAQLANAIKISSNPPRLLKIKSTSIDPQVCIKIPEGGFRNEELEVSCNIKSNKKSTFKVFWTEADNKNYSEAYSKAVSYEGGQPQTICLKIKPDHATWLRVDPGCNEDEYEISNFTIKKTSQKQFKERFLSKLQENQLQIDYFEDDHIKGKISIQKDKILFLPILYSKGWDIRVNGESTLPLRAQFGFIGIPLKKGIHSIELSFRTIGLSEGFTITIFGLIAFILIFYRSKFRSIKSLF